jgi:hypothetical protein
VQCLTLTAAAAAVVDAVVKLLLAAGVSPIVDPAVLLLLLVVLLEVVVNLSTLNVLTTAASALLSVPMTASANSCAVRGASSTPLRQ